MIGLFFFKETCYAFRPPIRPALPMIISPGCSSCLEEGLASPSTENTQENVSTPSPELFFAQGGSDPPPTHTLNTLPPPRPEDRHDRAIVHVLPGGPLPWGHGKHYKERPHSVERSNALVVCPGPLGVRGPPATAEQRFSRRPGLSRAHRARGASLARARLSSPPPPTGVFPVRAERGPGRPALRPPGEHVQLQQRICPAPAGVSLRWQWCSAHP